MGVLTVFFVADPSEAVRVGASLNRVEEFHSLDAKGMDQVKLGTLYAILTQKPFDPEFMFTPETNLYSGSDDGPWVELVPDNLTKLVASLDERRIASASEAWSETDEFNARYSYWSKADVRDFLADFAALCRRAVSERKSVLMWICL